MYFKKRHRSPHRRHRSHHRRPRSPQVSPLVSSILISNRRTEFRNIQFFTSNNQMFNNHMYHGAQQLTRKQAPPTHYVIAKENTVRHRLELYCTIKPTKSCTNWNHVIQQHIHNTHFSFHRFLFSVRVPPAARPREVVQPLPACSAAVGDVSWPARGSVPACGVRLGISRSK